MLFGIFWALIIGMNLVGFTAFALDKRASMTGGWRISEDRLLAIAFLGGSLGCKLAQMTLRHKTRKEPFKQQLNGIVAVQIVALAALFAVSQLA